MYQTTFKTVDHLNKVGKSFNVGVANPTLIIIDSKTVDFMVCEEIFS